MLVILGYTKMCCGIQRYPIIYTIHTMRLWVSYNIQDLYNETLGILQYTGSVQ